MTLQKFNKLLEKRLKKILEVLKSKGAEYGEDTDRLRDFQLIAQVAGVPVGIAWRVLNAKHLVSIYNMFDGKLEITERMIDEKCGDEINYGLLAEALLNEMRKFTYFPVEEHGHA